MLAFGFLGLSIRSGRCKDIGGLCGAGGECWGLVEVRWREEGSVGLDMCRYGRKHGRKKEDERPAWPIYPSTLRERLIGSRVRLLIRFASPPAIDPGATICHLLFSLSSGKKEGIGGAEGNWSSPPHCDRPTPFPIPSTCLYSMKDLEHSSSSIQHTLPPFFFL